ncbi:MAG TPA: transcription antitermination factor NusB [Rhizomicrobium sp.]|nr:transcription antitermination factor NusB [Rhizomicrobium sp.]
MTEQAGLPARKAALAIISGVLRSKRPLDSLLDSTRGLSRRDASFARAVASGTLRHMGILEAVLRRFAPRSPEPHRAGATSEILLLGACELLILEVPAHAAVDAANWLAAGDSKAVHFKPLINAVLRRVAKEGEAMLGELDLARLSLPDWLWHRWKKQYGEKIARAIAQVQQMPPPLDIVLKNGGDAFPQSAPLVGAVRRLEDAGRIEELEGFEEGAWWVQDVAASLPVLLLGEVNGRRVVDLCAAPGGKTLQLAARGANVVAVDVDAARLERVRANLLRTRLSAQLILGDARDMKVPAPLVLIDVPCSATGTIRRHPDLPWIRGAADVTAAAARAYEILEQGAAMVAPEGMLVFAVCSLEREEGEEQIEAFLASHPDFARMPVTAVEMFGHADWITPRGDLRTLPCHLAEQGGMDGFYAARLRRN